MSRTKTGFVTKKRHKKIIKFNKGYRGSHSRLFKVSNQQNMRSFTYAYADRRKRKRLFRRLWIKQLNCVAKENSTNYSTFIKKLKSLKIELNRKILSKISINDNKVFKSLIEIK